jgi:hypothetical protein
MEINLANKIQQIIIVFGLIIIGAIGRYILFGLGTQPFPNFEIIMVISFIAVMLLRSNIALFVPLCSMILSDILIGNPIFIGSQMNKIVMFTYSGFALIAVANIFLRERIRSHLSSLKLQNLIFIGGIGLIFVLVYDVWTNFGWWYLMYPHTAETMTIVYLAGIPFMLYHLMSGLITFIFIGAPVVYLVLNNNHETMSEQRKFVQKIPVVLITLIVISLAFSGTATHIPRQSEIWLEKAESTSVSIIISGDTWTLEDNLFAYDNETVFSLLERILNRHDILFEYTYYSDFNANLIDTIHITKNGDDGKYWQYWVNDELPMVGVDHFTIENGDIVEWRFETIPT